MYRKQSSNAERSKVSKWLSFARKSKAAIKKLIEGISKLIEGISVSADGEMAYVDVKFSVVLKAIIKYVSEAIPVILELLAILNRLINTV